MLWEGSLPVTEVSQILVLITIFRVPDDAASFDTGNRLRGQGSGLHAPLFVRSYIRAWSSNDTDECATNTRYFFTCDA